MFLAVIGSLPERVNVLPTENYYYVRFAHKGVRYAGEQVKRKEGKTVQ